jgi:hypothetical protein
MAPNLGAIFICGSAMSAIIYIDESGDLGWTLDKPYRRGGSSRHITISAIVVPTAKKHLPKRLVRHLYEHHNWDVKTERKWTEMEPQEKTNFASKVAALCVAHPDIMLYSCITYKSGVNEARSKDPNLLYNYMIKKMLLDVMAQYDRIVVVPDPRSIKVKSGNSLRDYLTTELLFTKEAQTELIMQPIDSDKCLNLQFTDMLAGAVQGHFEDQRSDCWDILENHVQITPLYFP